MGSPRRARQCCPCRENWRTVLWQREQWATLPDIPWVGIVLTMPGVFWPVFKSHPYLAARSAGTGCCSNSPVGVEPIPGTLVRDRHTADLWRVSQPQSAPAHDVFRRRVESCRMPLSEITEVRPQRDHGAVALCRHLISLEGASRRTAAAIFPP